MPVADRRRRALVELDRLSTAGHDTVRFWREAGEVLRSVVPFDFHPCWFTLDPQHLLITGHYNAGLSATPEAIVRSQYAEDDVNAFIDLARGAAPAATVAAATRGDPAASWRWTNLLVPMGFDDALDAVLRVRGTTWGALSLLHGAGGQPFTAADVRFVSRLSPVLATGTRLGLLRGADADAGHEAPAVVVVTPDLSVASMTPSAPRWLADLPDTGSYRDDRLPVAVQVAVVRARHPGAEAAVRVRGRSGRWLQVHAAPLDGAAGPRVAVVVGEAPAAAVTPLLLFAHELSPRERDVVDLVLRGRSTEQIADALLIAPLTVQDRLKAVFDKLGVRSRREIVSLVHSRGAQPVLDENDDRVRSGRPLLAAARTRGGVTDACGPAVPAPRRAAPHQRWAPPGPPAGAARSASS